MSSITPNPQFTAHNLVKVAGFGLTAAVLYTTGLEGKIGSPVAGTVEGLVGPTLAGNVGMASVWALTYWAYDSLIWPLIAQYAPNP